MTWVLFIPELYCLFMAIAFFGLSMAARPNPRRDHLVALFLTSIGMVVTLASVRLEGIWVSFPQSALVPDAMFLQAKTFLELGEEAEARRIFAEITRRYPEHYQTKRATDYLRHLEHHLASLG